MIAWKYCFDKAGLFNDNLKSGGDMEWGKEALAKGCDIVYKRNVQVKHPARSEIEELVNKWKRVAGGIYNSKKLYGQYSIARGFLPPVNNIKSAINNKKLSTKEKFISISISYYLKLICNLEILKLKLKFTDEKRV